MQIATGSLRFASFLFLLKGCVVLKKSLVSANKPFDRHVISIYALWSRLARFMLVI